MSIQANMLNGLSQQIRNTQAYRNHSLIPKCTDNYGVTALRRVEKEVWRVPKFSAQVEAFVRQRLSRPRQITILTKPLYFHAMNYVLPLSIYEHLTKAINSCIQSAFKRFYPDKIKSQSRNVFCILTHKAPHIKGKFANYDLNSRRNLAWQLHDDLIDFSNLNCPTGWPLRTHNTDEQLSAIASDLSFRPYWSIHHSGPCSVFTDNVTAMIEFIYHLERKMDNLRENKLFRRHAPVIHDILQELQRTDPQMMSKYRQQAKAQLIYTRDLVQRRE